MFFSKTNTNLRRIVTSLCTKSYICPWSRELERSRTAGVGGIYRTGHGSGNDGHPSKVHLRRYLQPWCNRLADTRAARLLRTDHIGSREPAPFALSRQHQRRQFARDIDRRRHPVPALHRFPCCYQGVAHHQRGICPIFYFRYFLKNASILSNGMMSVLSYKSVWLAPGIISSSLLSPLNLAKASCEAGSE